MNLQSDAQRALGFYDLSEILQNIPNFITLLRIVALPHLVYAFNNQITLAAYVLFLFTIVSDLADGYAARKLNATSKLGGYLDVSVDFIFISGIYMNFIINGSYSPWIIVVILGVFTQFIFSNLYLKQIIYDPIGKYYGSLLFGGVGLTLLFQNQIVYAIVTYSIIIFTAISSIGRITHFLKKR